jgi:DNA polymerase-3 subunit beta
MDATTSTSITLDAAAFRRALRLCAHALPTHRFLSPPALDIIAHSPGAALRARGGDMEITVAITPETPILYATPLPADCIKKLFTSATHAGNVTFTPTPNRLHVQLDDLSATLACDTPVYEPLINIEIIRAATVHRIPLAHALAICSHAISTEFTRYYLNGICIHPHPQDKTALAFAATDGHRLVQHIITGNGHALTESVIVPREAIAALRACLAQTTQEPDAIEIYTSPNRIVFCSAAFRIEAKLIDGTFPDYQRVIPRDVSPAVTFTTAQLRRFCTRLAGFRMGFNPGVALHLDKAAGTVTATWDSADIGSISAPLDGTPDRDLTIGFQYRYLVNMLDALRAPTITMHASDQSGPTIFAPAGELADPATTYVIMPMRV